MSQPNKVPSPVIAVVAEILARRYTHAQLDVRFLEKGAPGEPPEGSKPVKCSAWLARVNTECADPFTVVGELIEDVMELTAPASRWESSEPEDWKADRDRISTQLAKYGLRYQRGAESSVGHWHPAEASPRRYGRATLGLCRSSSTGLWSRSKAILLRP